MDVEYYTKQGAQQGDVFVMLKQAVMLESPSIFEDLQSQYGGRIRFPFHITCQRFSCKAEQLAEVVVRLELYLQTITPFSISVDSVQSLHSEFFNCEVLKARAHPTDYLLEIMQNIDAIVNEQGLERLYKLPSIWISVLEGINEPVPQTKVETDETILDVDFAVIDQLQADKSFNLLKEINLG